ncbi:helix-turn-helix domain-containing protein [Mycobacterium sp. 1274761.0]|uniref:helix-turn-helix domain-containing protein n=1 Tax=Mycobacterium sp. 1274761.0 TaxID=1834077 RepID=UPI0026CC432D
MSSVDETVETKFVVGRCTGGRGGMQSHIHRSTLRYRLARISELTGYDLRNVNTRFNLHAATRAWRFLYPEAAR